MLFKKCLLPLVLLLLILTNAPHAQVPPTKTFTNPILPAGADPWVIHKDNYYYYTNSTGKNLTIWKTRSMADLNKAAPVVVWTPPQAPHIPKSCGRPSCIFCRVNGICILLPTMATITTTGFM